MNKRTLEAVAEWAADSDLVEGVLKGVLVVLAVGTLLLLSLFVPNVVDSVGNWVLSNDPNLVLVGLVPLAAVVAILALLRLAARWLGGKISARRAAVARRASDRQGDMPRGCRVDNPAGDDPGGGVDLAVTDRGSTERSAGWVVFAVLLGAALLLLRRRTDR